MREFEYENIKFLDSLFIFHKETLKALVAGKPPHYMV